MPTNRINKIEEEIKRCLSMVILSDVKDDRLSKMVSVTKVDVTPDLKFAKAYVSVYDTDKNKEATMDALKSASSFIRTQMAHKVNIRRMPQFTFVLDDSIEYSMKISKIIDDINREHK